MTKQRKDDSFKVSTNFSKRPVRFLCSHHLRKFCCKTDKQAIMIALFLAGKRPSRGLK